MAARDALEIMGQDVHITAEGYAHLLVVDMPRE
jgi:hypothetical protein